MRAGLKPLEELVMEGSTGILLRTSLLLVFLLLFVLLSPNRREEEVIAK